jgi:CheY-like chemotaxis protein
LPSPGLNCGKINSGEGGGKLVDSFKISFEPPKILVIDPEPFIRELLKIKLEPLGTRVEFAEDEDEVKRALLEHRPELIIIDILHPRLDAYKFVQGLKNNPKLEAIKVVILTFKKRDPATWFLYNVWVEAFFEKPFVPDQFARKVKEIMQLSGAVGW